MSANTQSKIVHQPSAVVDINAPMVLPEYLKSSSTRMYELETAGLLEEEQASAVKFENDGDIDTQITKLAKGDDIMSEDDDDDDDKKKKKMKKKKVRDPLLGMGLKKAKKALAPNSKVNKQNSKKDNVKQKIQQAMKKQTKSGQWAS